MSSRAIDESSQGIAQSSAMTLHELLSLHYGRLRMMARACFLRLPRTPTQQTTALVHEAFMRLERRGRLHWQRPTHFFADMQQAMRDHAVERARARRTAKRGGQLVRTDRLSQLAWQSREEARVQDTLAISRALQGLEYAHPDIAQVVFLRFYCDMSMKEIAIILQVTVRTVERRWAFARAWLKSELAALP